MAEKWIQHAIKHKGAATRKAQAEGLPVQEWAQNHAGDDGITGEQARLATTLHNIGQHEDNGTADAGDAPEASDAPTGGMGLMH